MKKNVMMRVASALLVAVLMTTCAISGTFAKYTTSDTASDNARVAYWGVTVEVTGENAFAKKYDDTASDSGVKVVSDTEVVAPGTEGTLATVAITGTPEVMVNVNVAVDLELVGWVIDTNVEYCPLVFTVGATEIKQTGTIEEFEEAVETAVINELKKENVTVGTNLADNLTVSWEWAYTNGDEADVKDTKLADLSTAPTVAFTCTVDVTQVD